MVSVHSALEAKCWRVSAHMPCVWYREPFDADQSAVHSALVGGHSDIGAVVVPTTALIAIWNARAPGYQWVSGRFFSSYTQQFGGRMFVV
jgi:ABC-type spermidine/putrescine transport system permease subunit II